MSKATFRKSGAKEDVWIRSVCDMCFARCPIKVHRVDGVAVTIQGDPEGPFGNGKLCAKGFAALMSLYDPNRLTKPMKRTNPEKGRGVDPKWQEISWDEALDTIADRLKKIREDDPRKVIIASFDEGPALRLIRGVWGPAFGTPNTNWTEYYCGNYLHAAMYLTNGTFHSTYDVQHCNYVILLGNQMGFMVGINANITSQATSDARIRGMKVVAVDPVLSNAAGKADEWVPIRPGTDGAFIIAIINVLVNELG
ncbi:MAG: molybdopterin-dependent oxidoreductase, partial [Dehalococcoidia bacterium]